MITFYNLNELKRDNILFEEPGDYIVFFHNLSGEYTFDIKASNVNLEIYGLFIGKGMSEYRIQTVQRHVGPSSTSSLFIKGVFHDKSKLHYQGLIRIEKHAQKSHAYQKNQNLILSSDAFVESKPYLEILANDVFCTHGSTTGRLNKELLFYAKSRGLTDDMAEKMLVDGFVREITDKIKEKVPDFNYVLS